MYIVTFDPHPPTVTLMANASPGTIPGNLLMTS